MNLDTSRWRSSPTYDFVDDLVAPDLAWEWLRRNADYQRDYAEVGRLDTDRQRLTKMVRMRWGLQFPCEPNFQRQRNDGVLGAGSRSGHSHAHRDPAIAGYARRCTN
ncbi:DUF6499 domain-containing protein [Reyranella sp.]|uniref:transcriptional regulator domain-containing protein n=1 Tax=Reyranella sp. TaxID=1929291 RepID=UPI002614596C|nr:DUF6499 domain-containing protein [Reyranella sp.]HQS18388.1 DUF6499 domain-containing protein [Reyranella sp.]HQT15122.1 DUF6499 domain-containing protein [Reyranella sp.]